MRLSLLLTICILFLSTTIYGHGVSYSRTDDHAVSVKFQYSGGDPMSYASVLVFGPHSDPDLEYQNGRTDTKGKFAFIPDRAGLWKVIAEDGTGHKGVLSIQIDPASFKKNESRDASSTAEHSSSPKTITLGAGGSFRSILLGLSLIANLTLVIALIRTRKRT